MMLKLCLDVAVTTACSLSPLESIFFLLDLLLQFFLPFSVKTRYGRHYVHHHRSIVVHYLRTWFLLDLLSILPGAFDVYPYIHAAYMSADGDGHERGRRRT